MTIPGWRFALVSLSLLVRTAHAGGTGLPDLVAVIDPLAPPKVERNATVHPGDVAEGCAKAETGNTVVHFALSSYNVGTADLVLGDPGCPDCEQNPEGICTNELFECSPLAGHGHPHFTKYAIYEILPAPDAPVAAAGHKQSFCIEDTICPNQPKVFDCFNQGLQVGCQDLYPPYAIGCQYVDVTDLPGGRYLLQTTINYEHLLPESNYDNNVDQKPVDVCEGIRGPRVRFGFSKRTAETWRWKVTGRADARAPLVDVDPFKDGAWVRMVDLGAPGATDDRTLVDVEIPGRPGAGHCGPHDGWKRNPDSPGPVYSNVSGFLDRDCMVSADGLRRFGGVVRTRESDGVRYGKVTYRIAGTATGPRPAGRLRVEVGLGTETGPCWTAAADCDGKRKCVGDSAAGAFVD